MSKIHEKFDEAIDGCEILGDGEIDFEDWQPNNWSHKGCICGLGNLAPNITCSCSHSEGEAIQRLESQLAATKSQVDQITLALIQQGFQLPVALEENCPSLGTIQRLEFELAVIKFQVDQITSVLIQQGFQLPVAPEENCPSPRMSGSKIRNDNSPPQRQ